MTIVSLNPDWYGSESIAFQATFPDGTSDEDQVIVQVKGPVLDSYDEFEEFKINGGSAIVLFEFDGTADYDDESIWVFSTCLPPCNGRAYDICIEVLQADEEAVRVLLEGKNYVGPFPLTQTRRTKLPMTRCSFHELLTLISPSTQ